MTPDGSPTLELVEVQNHLKGSFPLRLEAIGEPHARVDEREKYEGDACRDGSSRSGPRHCVLLAGHDLGEESHRTGEEDDCEVHVRKDGRAEPNVLPLEPVQAVPNLAPFPVGYSVRHRLTAGPDFRILRTGGRTNP